MGLTNVRLDGSSVAVPAFIVAPRGQKVEVSGDIGGPLAERFYQRQPTLCPACPIAFAEPSVSEDGDELQVRLLKHFWALVDYWKVDERDGLPVRDRMAGLAYSILRALDRFIVAPLSSEEDIESWREIRCHWWPRNDASARGHLAGVLSGCLHEHLGHFRPHDPRCVARAEKVGRSPSDFCSCAEYATR